MPLSISSSEFPITKDQIDVAIDELAKNIILAHPHGCTVCGVLKAGERLLREIEKRIKQSKNPHLYTFTTIGAKTMQGASGPNVGLYDIPSHHLFFKKHIALVDTVLDSGRTFQTVGRYIIDSYKPRQIVSVALCAKTEELPPWADDRLVGFLTPKDDFIVGFGLDLNDQYRDLDEIRSLTQEDKEKADG